MPILQQAYYLTKNHLFVQKSRKVVRRYTFTTNLIFFFSDFLPAFSQEAELSFGYQNRRKN